MSSSQCALRFALVLVVLCSTTYGQRHRKPLTNIVSASYDIPAGGDRVLDVTLHLRNKNKHDCMLPEYMVWYPKCQFEEPEAGCSVLKDCPDICTAQNGDVYPAGSSWEQGDRLCRCSSVGSVYYSVPPIPPGGVPFPPINDCKLNGCRHPTDSSTMKELDEATMPDGRKCICKAGNDPNIMDTSTLFHLECVTADGQPTEAPVAETTASTAATSSAAPTAASISSDPIVAEADEEIAAARAEAAVSSDPIVAEADREIAEAKAEDRRRRRSLLRRRRSPQ